MSGNARTSSFCELDTSLMKKNNYNIPFFRSDEKCRNKNMKDKEYLVAIFNGIFNEMTKSKKQTF